MSAIIVAPSVLLLLAWIQIFLSRRADRVVHISWVPLIVITTSDIYLWASAAFHDLLGPDYSNLRHGLIGLNLLVALGAAIVFCFSKSAGKWLSLVASVSLAVTWLLVGAISSAV